MQTVLVTGGLGVIGSMICRALLAVSCRPVIYDAARDMRLVADIAQDCVIEHGDARDLPRLVALAARHRPAAIVHFAGQTGRQVEEHPWSALETNLMGTATMFECARLAGVPRVVFASSKMVYGPVAEAHRHPTYQPVPEEHPREPEDHYGNLKRTCETVGAHYAHLYGLHVIALRSASVFGPGKFGLHDRVSPVIALIEAAIARRPFRIESGGEQGDELCYTRDCAGAVVAALESPARPGVFRAYNVSSGELITLHGMIAALKELYPGWQGEAGPGLDYRGYGVAHYFRMATQRARDELGFEAKFDFRSAVLDYARTQGLARTP